MIHDFSYLSDPLEDNILDFVADVVRRYIEGTIDATEYHVSLGKAIGYVECRFSLGKMSTEDAYDLVCDIKERI